MSGEVDAHVAGMTDWWKCDDHVDFLGSSVSQCSDDILRAGSADDAVVNYDDVLPIDHRFDRDHFPDDLFTALVCRLDEASQTALSSVAVFHQTLLHRYAALFRVA